MNPETSNRQTEAAAAAAPIYPSDFNSYDVLLGRGSQLVQYQGNVLFRELVYKRRDEYAACVRHHFKDQIAREVIEAIESQQGRFLRKDDSVPSGTPAERQRWVLADATVVLEKVKQAFRDSFKKPIPESLESNTDSQAAVHNSAAAAAASRAPESSRNQTYSNDGNQGAAVDLQSLVEQQRQRLLLEQYQNEVLSEHYALRAAHPLEPPASTNAASILRAALVQAQQQQEQQHRSSVASHQGDTGGVGDETILRALLQQRQIQQERDQLAEQRQRFLLAANLAPNLPPHLNLNSFAGHNLPQSQAPNFRVSHAVQEQAGMLNEMEQRILLAAARSGDPATLQQARLRLLQQRHPSVASTMMSNRDSSYGGGNWGNGNEDRLGLAAPTTARDVNSLESVARLLHQPRVDHSNDAPASLLAPLRPEETKQGPSESPVGKRKAAPKVCEGTAEAAAACESDGSRPVKQAKGEPSA
jgi:hypothetical protein